MDKQDLNRQQLSNFVEKHNLRNRHSIIHFNAVVSITTAKNKLVNKQIEVMISFDNYNSLGQVTLMESELDSMLFPTIFEAIWQSMEHIEDEHLLISGIHRKNPLIGKYSVKIIPLNKLKD